MPRAKEEQAGIIADALWRAFRPQAIELLDAALASQPAMDGPDGSGELTPEEHARVDAAVSRFRQRRRTPAPLGRPKRKAAPGGRSARLTPKGGEP